MKIAFVILIFVSYVSAQSGSGFYDVTTWAENSDTNGGAIVQLPHPPLGNGSCIVSLPDAVELFHIMDGFVVPSGTDTTTNVYKITAPTHWTNADGDNVFNALIVFNTGASFDVDDIQILCNEFDIEDINVYSFPQNTLRETASSAVCYRQAFHEGDTVTITLPVPVRSLNFTTWEDSFAVTNLGDTIFILTGFTAEYDNNYNTEVAFRLEYDDDGFGNVNWFSAGDISVSVIPGPPPGR